MAYLQRHESRNEMARQADKLFHIVDKYLPSQADETRAFVARFPERVHTLLPKARKIRNKLRRDGGTDPATGEFTSQGDSFGHGSGDALLQLTEEADRAVTKHVTTESRPREVVTTLDAPSRGDSSKPSAALQGELPQPAERADHNEAHRARMVCRGSSPPDEDTPPDWGDDDQTDDDPTHDSWPWGESGRPSDQGHSEGILGQKPNEPVGAPRGGGVLGRACGLLCTYISY